MEGWEQKILGDLCEFRRGLTYKKADEVDASRNAVLRANNITVETGELNFDEIRYIREDIEVPKKKKVFPGALLVCTASGSKKHLGKVGIVTDDVDFAFGGFMGLLLAHEQANPKFLFWYTRSNFYRDFIFDLSDGVNINNLKWSQLSELPVPLPPLPEQERIVAILDEAFAAIETATAHTEKNLANARELFESQLQALLNPGDAVMEGWERCKITDIVHPLTTVNPRKDPQIPFEYIDVSSVSRSTHKVHETTKLLGADAPSRARRKVHAGDVLFATIRPTLQRITIIPDHLQGAICSTGYYVLRPRDQVLSSFLFYYLFSEAFSSEMEELQRGASYPAVSDRDVKEHLLFLPPLPEQERIVDNLDAASEKSQQLCDAYDLKLEHLSHLKQSLLQKAFTGELTSDKKAADRTLSEAGL